MRMGQVPLVRSGEGPKLSRCPTMAVVVAMTPDVFWLLVAWSWDSAWDVVSVCGHMHVPRQTQTVCKVKKEDEERQGLEPATHTHPQGWDSPVVIVVHGPVPGLVLELQGATRTDGDGGSQRGYG